MGQPRQKEMLRLVYCDIELEQPNLGIDLLKVTSRDQQQDSKLEQIAL
jgi:hypothetical protein